MSFLPKPFYRYDLDLELPALKPGAPDPVADLALDFRDRLGEEEFKKQLAARQLSIEVISDESWGAFEQDIQSLSGVLTGLVSGRAMYIEPGEVSPVLKGWCVLGVRGQLERLSLDLGWNDDEEQIVDGGVDAAEAIARWEELPTWVRVYLRSTGVTPSDE